MNSTDLSASATLLANADPDRFRAVMAAPRPSRAVLFPLYAANAEVARAPWASKEPMIVAMRLQWWRDVLGEIIAGGPVRGHEVATPLGAALSKEAAAVWEVAIELRLKDCEARPFEDTSELLHYLEQTGGSLLWAAALALGAPERDERSVRKIGTAQALANYFCALPELEARGKQPVPDGRPEALAELARSQLQDWPRDHLSQASRIACIAAFAAKPRLKVAAAMPERIATGKLVQPFRESLTLLKVSAFARM